MHFDILPQVQTLDIYLPNGAPSGVSLEVVSTDSTRFFEVARQLLLEDAAEAKEAAEGGAEAVKDIEAGLRKRARQISACIVGWSGLTSKGVEVPYSEETALALFSQPGAAYICEQVEGYVTKRTNFFRSGSEPA